MKRAILATVVLLGATAATAGDRPRFDADATLRRAEVGVYSPRLAPPVRVSLGESARLQQKRSTSRQIQQRFEQIDCRVRESTDYIVCVAIRPEEVNRPKK